MTTQPRPTVTRHTRPTAGRHETSRLGLAGDAFRLEGAELEMLLLSQASALREVGP